MIKSSYSINNKWSQFGALELVEVKHPKETRFQSRQGEIFVFGKSNYLYVIRPQYGREYVFFRKAPESGVQVNGILAAGPSFGLLVPYYIKYDYTDPNGGIIDIRSEQYDPNVHTDFETRIIGKSSFLTGLGETDFNIGAHLKGGISFEYGRYNEGITGVEVGFVIEKFAKELVIIPAAQNRSSYSSVYLTLYYGRRK